jgi:cAMP-binding proteins - catabolite gene activator and regulatory subunit of cAMP-dependent protein kinases
METNWTLLGKSPLFRNISETDLKHIYTCLSARKVTFPKNTFIFRADEDIRFVYIILSGCIQIIDEDFWGNQSILETMHPYLFFGEAYVFSDAQRHLVSVMATVDSEILLINPERLLKTCSHACDFHAILIENMVRILSQKITLLTQKMSHVIQRTTRKKLVSYFSLCASREQSSSFSIPYSRQQLADFLSVDRSALSHELSRMRDENLIRYHKNHFTLLKNVL